MRLFLCLTMIAVLAGCAQPAKVSGMTTQNVAGGVVAANPALLGTLTVGAVTGGQETSPMWTSEVDSPSFKAALEQSLLTNALLANIPANAPYRVEAHLAELEQPLIAVTSNVTSVVQYRVFDAASSQLWFEKTINATGSASVGDAFYGVDRLRIANERSIEANIQRFIEAYLEEWKKRPATTS